MRLTFAASYYFLLRWCQSFHPIRCNAAVKTWLLLLGRLLEKCFPCRSRLRRHSREPPVAAAWRWQARQAGSARGCRVHSAAAAAGSRLTHAAVIPGTAALTSTSVSQGNNARTICFAYWTAFCPSGVTVFRAFGFGFWGPYFFVKFLSSELLL